jgi:hypothetical protein
VRTKPTMRERMLRSVLAAVFSAPVAFGVLGATGFHLTDFPADSGWDSVQAVAGPPDSGWDAPPAKAEA